MTTISPGIESLEHDELVDPVHDQSEQQDAACRDQGLSEQIAAVSRAREEPRQIGLAPQPRILGAVVESGDRRHQRLQDEAE